MPLLDVLQWHLPLANGGAAAPPPGGGLMSTLLLFAPIFVLFYILMIRPQQQMEKQRKRMIEALKKNDRVLTSAGIYGTVVSIDANEDRMVLKVSDNTKIDVTRSSVVRVLDGSAEKAAEAK